MCCAANECLTCLEIARWALKLIIGNLALEQYQDASVFEVQGSSLLSLDEVAGKHSRGSLDSVCPASISHMRNVSIHKQALNRKSGNGETAQGPQMRALGP